MHYRTLMVTAFGWIAIEVDDRGAVTSIEIGRTQRQKPSFDRSGERHCDPVVRQLSEYLDGARQHFELALAPSGSDFQREVWREVGRIPYGATRSYGDVARRLGDVSLARAVGAANGANPIPIIIPCHRVIGADGSLVGYGGGLDLKRRLLELEEGVVAGHQRGLDFG